jgi:hypothetical protein
VVEGVLVEHSEELGFEVEAGARWVMGSECLIGIDPVSGLRLPSSDCGTISVPAWLPVGLAGDSDMFAIGADHDLHGIFEDDDAGIVREAVADPQAVPTHEIGQEPGMLNVVLGLGLEPGLGKSRA